jgi:hypothetical protein
MTDIQAHVDTCPSCQRQLQFYHTTAQALQEDNPPEVQERIWRSIQRGLRGGAAQRSRIPLAMGSVVTAFLAVFVAIILVVAHQSAHPSTVATVTPRATPPLPKTTSDPLAPPWVTLVSETQRTGYYDFAFPAGAPQTIYACAPEQNPHSGFLRFLQSTDKGQTWHSLARVAGNGVCHLSLDPFQSNTIALTTLPCPNVACDLSQPGSGNQSALLYRSDDGGNTWATIPLAGVAARVDQLTWQGNTLWFVDTRISVQNTLTFQTDLYAAQGTQPQTITTNGSINTVRLYGVVARFLSTQTTLFLGHFTLGADGQSTSIQFWRSDDHGVTWTTVTNAQITSITPDGVTLIAAGLRFSHDDGRTWTQRAFTYPANDQLEFVTLTPDGTVFARILDTQGKGYLCRQLNGETTCAIVQTYGSVSSSQSGARQYSVMAAPLAPLPGIIAVTWDAQGHPAAIYQGDNHGDGVTLYRLDL